MHQKEKCKSLLFMIIIGLLVAILILVYIYIYFRDEVFRRKYILDDSKGNIIQVQTQYPVLGGGGQVFLTYNENGRCVFKKEWINEYEYIYLYNADIKIWEKLCVLESEYGEEINYVYTYDNLGRIEGRHIQVSESNVSVCAKTYKYIYDFRNRLSDIEIYDTGTDEQVEWISYSYDEKGRCVKREWGYTEAGYERLEKKDSDWDVSQAVSMCEWEYDKDDNIIKETEYEDFMKYSHGKLSTLEWDSDGVLLSKTEASVDGVLYKTIYEYENGICVSGKQYSVGTVYSPEEIDEEELRSYVLIEYRDVEE